MESHSIPPPPGPEETAPTQTPPPENSKRAPPKRDNHTPSCAVCQRRKVKCDRVYPCAPCRKTGLECEFRASNDPIQQKPRKRQKRSLYESHDSSSVPRPYTPPVETARMVAGDARYENGGHPWSAESAQAGALSSVGPEAAPRAREGPYPRPPISGDSIYESSVALGTELAGGNVPRERHFLFDQPSQPTRFPPAEHIVQLWQAYLTNVDPVMKVVHAGTLQVTVLGQIAKGDIPTSMQALTWAIYFVSVVSLDEDECAAKLQSNRSELVARYRQATEDALSAARFVTTTSIEVLQALVIYLATIRSLGETTGVWSMTGLAIRIAGTIGLSRDGSKQNLSPFDAEMRRRIWWALCYLDARTAEIVGQEEDLLMQGHDVHLPANINDIQLFPDMQRLPESRPAATEVAYVLLRAMLASTLRAMPETRGGPASSWLRLRNPNTPMVEKATIVEKLEHMFHEEVLRFCDPTVPLQAFTLNSARTFLTKMRLVGNIPFDRSATTAGTYEGYSENLFQLAMKMMELQLELFTDAGMRKWRWHWNGMFQWYALAELVRQTRLRGERPDGQTGRAWELLREVFERVVPGLDPEVNQGRLLDAVRELLRVVHHDGHDDEISATRTGAGTGQEDAAAQNTTPDKRRYMGFSIGQGSRAFSALLPGMNSLPAPLSMDEQLGSAPVHNVQDPALGMEFDGVDWAEFDRLTAELCGR
ncbi:hypothetical protein LTR15_008437 [Elasticomyces elasticus]|nr:hypothetical protein LTR15_008437 [Elasticomyces elasticus]